MSEKPLELQFNPKTIKHLGLKMYSTLPPALAELISNSYDADSEQVGVFLIEKDGKPHQIKVIDDGIGLSRAEINSKFLIIGRDRREEDGDNPSPKHERLPTGKKGLGKLALFGLAKTITIRTVRNKLLNEFVLDWDALQQSRGKYNPTTTKLNEPCSKPNGTEIILSKLKRKSPFDAEALSASLARIFIIEDSFQIRVLSPEQEVFIITNEQKYENLDIQFEWDIDELLDENSEWKSKLEGKLLTAVKPIPPSQHLRGITLFSRKKLVNSPEYFSDSTSSHFYSYLTGWITIDFIDLLPDDVISTNRKSLDWDNPLLKDLKVILRGIVAKANKLWREGRRQKKIED